jgi:ABC-type uncharacterized transport system permease subunit
MEHLARILQAMVPAAWMAAAAAYLLVFRRADPGADRWCRRLAFTAVGLQLLLFAAVGLAGRPMVASGGGVLASMGLAVAGVHLFLEGRIKTRAIGIFPVCIALGLSLGGAAADMLRMPAAAFPKWSTGVHVFGAVLAYSGLLLAALYGVLFLLQRWSLRSRRFGLLFERLPSLELLDQFSWRSLLAAVVFLTLTIAFGHVVGKAPGLAFDYYDPKIVFTNMLWLGSLLLTTSRGFRWLRPATSAWGCVILFTFAIGNMLIVDMFSRVHPAY